MIRGAVLIASSFSLAACAPGKQAAGDSAENAAAPSGAVGATPAAADAPTSTPPSGSRLSAQVSGLNADVSGLNTRITDMGLVVDLPADALFEFDEASLTAAAETELRKAAELIRRSPPGSIRVIGHTDSKGDDAYNQRLSEARAQAVAGWFGGQVGVRQREFVVSGQGEAAPIAPNARPDGSDDPAGRAKNRRVEVIVPSAGADG